MVYLGLRVGFWELFGIWPSAYANLSTGILILSSTQKVCEENL